MAQTTPVSDYRLLDGYTGVVSAGDDVCPTIDTINPIINSTNTFRVEKNNADAGDTWFEWVVYGGIIIENNGVAVNRLTENDADDPVINGIPYFYIQTDNYTTATIPIDTSEIVVQWHNDDMADSAWVAVRQISQWGCSDSTWSVFTQRVYNQQPVITDFPDSITIAYDDRLNYILPLPTATDPDACFDTLTYHFTITGASLHNGDSILANRTVNLGVGVNTITWTISDLMKDTVRSYTITVDPLPQITNIAWTNPTCFGNNDGTLYISDTLDHVYGGAFQYALAAESDTTFSPNRYFTDLWAGDTTVFAMIEYNVDLDNDGTLETTQQFSEGYTINLHNASEFAVDDIPDSTSSDVVINNAGCLKDNDGSIEVKFDNVTSLNNSLSFDGANDYLLLNKQYNSTLDSFSVAAWINVPEDNTSSGVIVSFDKDDYFQLRLSHSGSNSYVHFVSGAFTTGTGFSNSALKVNDGKWHLVVATYDHDQQVHSLYVDGVKATSGETNGTPGSLGNVRYGIIGASADNISTLSSYNVPTQYFYGSIAEVAIWDMQLLSDEHVALMMKDGMLNIGKTPSDHWALNDTPDNVQGPAEQDSVFTDIGNIQTESHWGRFYNGIGLNAQDSPALLSWTDNLAETTDSDYPSTNELTGLAVGEYTLHVKDIFGCGELTETYNIKNSDAEGPELYWNVALRKNATQIDVADNRDASLAVDGYGLAAPGGNSTLTTSHTNAWWKVDLGGVYSPVYKVRIFTGQHGLDDFYVLASNSYPFSSPSLADITAPNVTSKHYQVPVPVQDTVVINLSNIGVNVRYLCIMLAGTGPISLAEVEVLTDVGYTVERNLYLAGDSVCTFPVSSDIASIIPYAFDECDGIVSLEHDANTVEPGLGVSNDNLNGAKLGLGSHVFKWTTFDDAGLSDSIQVTYTVHDTINPRFNPYPFLNRKDTITYCQSLNYKLPIPKVFDNYYSCNGDTPSIKDLYLKWSYAGQTIFSFNDSTAFDDYNPNTISDSVLINRDSYLKPGDRIFVWQPVDYSDNTIYDSLYLHVEKHPLINEMSFSPASCIDGKTQAIFTRIQSEEGRDVNYIMYNVTGDSIKQLNNSVFNLDPGKYIASIEVNGCFSDEYGDTIEVLDVEPIRYDPEINPVVCTGDSGNIVINPTGGSNSNILHFLGGSGVAASVPNYAGLNLDTIGTIEGWIYLDTLAANTNVGLFGVQTTAGDDAYGFRTNGEGIIQFYVGENSINATIAISDTSWYYLRGSWIDDSLNFEIDSDVTSQGLNTYAQRFATVSAPTGGSLYVGCEGDGSGNNLRGFVRAVRVWNRTLGTDEIAYNRYLNDPANIDGLMANFLINSGTRNLQNRVQGSVDGTIAITYNDFTWQNYAYFWTNNTTGDFVARTRNLINYPDNYYHVRVHDPLGCVSDTVIYLYTNDIIVPTMVFSNQGYNGTPLTVGQPIWRYTSDSIGVGKNILGDCHFYPSSKEFDPYLYDGGCPVDALKLAFIIESGYIDADSLADADATISGDTVFIQSLDGIALTDETILNWIVTDRAGNSTEKSVNYYIIDNEQPTLYSSNQERFTDTLRCSYTVTETDSILGISYDDNCNTGRLYNNVNGTQSLEGEEFAPGEHTIRWIYVDKTLPAGNHEPYTDTIYQTLTVIDNQPPELICQAPFSVDLSSDGYYTLNNLDVVNSYDDNCNKGDIDFHLTKNIAYYTGTATMSSYQNGTCYVDDAANANAALDGDTSSVAADCSSVLTALEANPYWEVDLGAKHTLYGVRLFESDASTLENFWILVSSDGTFENTGDWTETGAVFGDSVIYAEYFSAPLSGDELFSFPVAVDNATHVQIRMNAASAQLSLAEVEVYGTTDPANAYELEFDCYDVRYTPGPNPVVQDGTFNPIGVLLSAIDNDGNISSCLTDVTVEDYTQPIVDANGNITFYLDDNGDVFITDPFEVEDRLDNGSSDACGIDSFWVSPDQFTCLNIGPRTVDLHVRDVNGNVANQAINIAIKDTLKPNMNVQSNIRLVLGDDGTYTINPRTDIDDGTSNDNCTDYASLIFKTIPEVVDCDSIGTSVPIIYSIRDLQGNDTTRVVYVEVADDDGPTAVLKEHELTIQSNNRGVIYFSDIIDSTSLRDNCTTDFTGRKFISYNVTGNWCAAGDEGSAAASAFTNIANLATPTGSAHYDSDILTYAIDNDLGTAYISNATSSERELILTFPQEYEFNRADVRWHEEDLTPSPTLISVTQNPTVTGSQAYPGYPLSNCNSNTIYDDYITNVAGSSYYVQYEFSQMFTLTNTRVYWYDWGNNTDPPTTASLDYWDGDSWESLGSISRNNGWNSLDFDDVYTDRIRLNFTENNRRVAISEWEVWGFAGPLQYDCELPVSPTRLQWDNAGVWTDVTPATGYTNIGLATANDNRLDFSSTIQTDRFRLLMYGDDRHVGVKELRLYGREMSAVNTACISFTCDDVGTEIPVFLLIEDEQGTTTEYETTVPVKSYFSIDDIQIYDCGVSGEVYTPTITGMDLGLTYNYLWTTLERPTSYNYWPYWNNEVYSRPFQNGGSYSTTSTQRSPMVQNRTIDWEWDNGLGEWVPISAMVSGDYVVNFNVVDGNGCFVDYEYAFTWRSENGGGADSEKQDSVCVNDTRTYQATPPPDDSYWSAIDYTWTYDTEVTLEDGGGIGNDWAEFSFPNAGTYEVNLSLVGYQEELYADPYVLTSDTYINCSNSYPCYVVESFSPNILSSTGYTSGRTFSAGQTVVRIDAGFNWYECREGVDWTIDVYDVPKPIFQAYDATVCLLDTITYTVDATQQAAFDHYSWSWTHGRQYAGGNADDAYITIIWDDYEDLSYYPLDKPSVKVIGYNKLNCSDSTTIEFDYSGENPPVLDCSGKNLVHGNTPGACTYTFQNIGPPLMTDDCSNRIESYYNDYNSGTNAEGEYPLGITTVTWYAYDYNGNVGMCSHTITVLDTEPPTFGAPPASNKRELSANNGCDHLYSGFELDMSASDLCSDSVTLTAAVYRDDNNDNIYDYAVAVDLATLDGYTFLQGRSRVEWTAADTADNSAYIGLGYNAVNNVTTEYFVTVSDNIAPEIAPLDSIKAVSGLDSCSVTLTVSPPGNDVISDNCSTDENLTVEFVSRDDGAELDDPFPVDTTTIIWRVYDEATPPNRTTATQVVVVTDEQLPWYDDADFALQDTSIGYCKRKVHKLPIPIPYDNCEVKSITWQISNNDGTYYNQTGTITRSESPNFNPNGDGFTDIIPTLPADSILGSDYTVTWSVVDAANNSNATPYSYTLHVEIQPYYDDIDAVESSCANDGSITVDITSSDFRYEPGREVEFSINGWQTSQSTADYSGNFNEKLAQAAQFTGLASGTYDVYMRVNGCDAPVVLSETIEQPEEYVITLSKTDPYCYEEQTGTITLSMTGGALGQIHFTNGTQTVTAGHYELLDSIKNKGLGAIQAWVYIESLADGANIVSKGSEYSLKIAEDSTIELNVGGAYVRTNFKPIMQRWYYIVGTWEVATNTMNIYVDGVVSNGATLGTLSAISASTDGITVGGSEFKGIVRDLSIWSLLSDGAVPSAKIPSSTPDLLGLWYMNEGTGDAINSLNSNNASAENISVSPQSLWESTLPQPGYYTWTKTGGLPETTFATTTDSISMAGLGIGVYSYEFQDCYGCPITPLTGSITLRGTDMTPPEISSMDSLIRYTDDECLFTALGSDTELWPVISDSCDCAFTTEWKLGGMTFPHRDSIDVPLILGQNKVEVTTLQNLNVTSNLTYYITVRDSTPPVPVVQSVDDISLSNDLYGGYVYYDAINFNLASDDNCTDSGDLIFQIKRNEEDEYSEEVRFDCDDVGDSVQIFFRAIDESGNIAETSVARMMVKDDHYPRFLYTGEPRIFTECALVAESGGTPAYNNAIPANTIVLDSTDYGDNCGIDSIMYKLEYYGDGTSIINTYSTDWEKCQENAGEIDTDIGDENTFYEGITRVYYRLHDSHGNTSLEKWMFTVDIIPQPEPSAIEGTDGN